MLDLVVEDKFPETELEISYVYGFKQARNAIKLTEDRKIVYA
jgi:hypothetical protein